jgi:hypothetical protein
LISNWDPFPDWARYPSIAAASWAPKESVDDAVAAVDEAVDAVELVFAKIGSLLTISGCRMLFR